MSEKLEEGMTICGGNSIERSDCFLHDEPCKHRSCKEMGKKDPQMLADYWLEKFLDVEKEAKALREIVAEYNDLLSRLCDLFTDEETGRRMPDAAEEVEAGFEREGVGL